jgi:D-sedoheptulose 7-phosphate isomerase
MKEEAAVANSAQTYAAEARAALLYRHPVFERFFTAEAERLAVACREMSRRFTAGGRLLAFGCGAASTDAQHVAVEFVHPVIVGKRALPALDLGAEFEHALPPLVQPDDMLMGFAPAGRDEVIERALALGRERGALTFGLAALGADYSFEPPDTDPFVCQEVFEVLYHVLWETVHVYFEHRQQGHDVGASSFLYPFLGRDLQGLDDVVREVQGSLLQKMEEVSRLRAATAEHEAESIAQAVLAIAERVQHGGKLIVFGNGGSATDANDLAIDCWEPPSGLAPLPALSLAMDPAIITAVANDVGAEAIFARQIIAHGGPRDVAVGISTSGGSANILAALGEARKHGLLTVGLVGYNGGRIVTEHLVDHVIVVRSDYVPRIQEVQASVYHVMRRLLHQASRA